jgi:hypothetical protein
LAGEFRWCRKKMQMTVQESSYLRDVLLGNKRYLEIGSGYSTIWTSQFVDYVVSIEARKFWFDLVSKLLRRFMIENVTLFHWQPESCAYDKTGNEKWPFRGDYGYVEEFSSYLQKIKVLLDKEDFDVVLVDGHVRREVVSLLFQRKFEGTILLHDMLYKDEFIDSRFLNCVKVLKRIKGITGEFVSVEIQHEKVAC